MSLASRIQWLETVEWPTDDAPAALQPFETWTGTYLSDYFPLPNSSFHRWLIDELSTLHTRRGCRRSVIAPRGSAKSTWTSFAYPLYVAVHGLEPYTLILSDTYAQATKHLDGIKHELETNERLADDYPAVCGEGDIWRQDFIRLRNGCVIEALGCGSKIRGRRNRAERPSLIIVDDVENEDSITSPTRREKTWRWFTRSVLNAGTGGTNVMALGTTLHRQCLVLRLHETPGWSHRLFKSIEAWPDRMELWSEWEGLLNDWDDPDRDANARAFYEANRDAMLDGSRVLWDRPDTWPRDDKDNRESLYDLMHLRATIGPSAFEAEKQGNPIDPSACEFPAEYFDYAGFWFDEWPETLEITTLGLDPSKGKDAKTGDFSAFVRLGRDAEGYLYCEADLRRRPAPAIVADGIEHCRAFNPTGFAVEVNQFQELFIAEFQRVALAQKIELPIFPLENTINKEVRIRQLGAYLNLKRLRFKRRSPGTALLVQQLRDFPLGDHDDGPDCLQLALRLMIQLFNSQNMRLPKGFRV